MDTIRERFFNICEQQGISMREVARRSGIDVATVSKIINGSYPANWKHRRAISNVLGVKPEDLFQLVDLF